MKWDLVLGDSLEVMGGMADESVFSIVTSPPYADQRRYDGSPSRETARNRHGHMAAGHNSSRRQRSEAPMRFAEDFRPFLHEMLRVVDARGSLMLNLGIVQRDGEESPYADEILSYARSIGWKLLHRMVWFKPNGNTLSDARYLRICHEWVFWLAKDVGAYRGFDRDTRTPHAPDSLRRIRGPYKYGEDERYAKRGREHKLHPDGARPTTVFTAGVGGQRGINHPAVMARTLALQLVSLSTPRGELVLDPFCGAATTGVACQERERDFLGIELHADYLEEARARLEGRLAEDLGSEEEEGALRLFT